MADERDRLRARLGLPPLEETVTSVTPTSIVDEQTQRAAMEPEPKLTGAERAAKTKQEREDRFAAELAAREASKPTEDPGEGNAWIFSVSENRWKKVRLTTVSTDNTKNNNNNNNDNNNNKFVNTNNNNAASTDALVDFYKAQADAATKTARESAFALLKLEFSKYGLSSLVDTVKKYIMNGSPVEEITLKLRETPEYQKRFAGNQIRLKAGLNVYDEATYLDLENAYDQIFTSYGVEESIGNTRELRQAKYAEFIGGTKSPDEIKGRVQLAVLASQEDTITKATMKELYPMLTDKDLVSYFLNPKETLPKLQTKIAAAQIGAAAVRQGLVTNVATAEELVSLGVTEEEAERAYSAYAGMKPRLDLLSSLEQDEESMVNQQVAEGALLKGLSSEQRKIEALRQKELGRFSGSAGVARNVSLGSQLGGTY